MIPINPSQIPTLFKEAQRLAASGAYDQADQLFARIANAAPSAAEVPFQRATLAAKQGDTAQAVSFFEAALKLKPKEAAIWQAYAALLAASPDDKRTRTFLAKAKSARLPAALLSALRDKVQPGPEALLATAHQLMTSGRFEPALAAVDRAIKLAPQALPARLLRADILVQMGDREGAEAAFRAILKTRPKANAARLGLAEVLALDPTRMDEAYRLYQTLQKDAPQDPRAFARHGIHLQSAGDFKAAEALLVKAVEIDPGFGEASLALARMSKRGLDDPLVAAMEARLGEETTPAGNRARTAFALAKIHEDNASYDQAFVHLTRANALASADNGPYTPEVSRALFQNLRDAFEGVDFTAPLTGTSDEAPIFVSGLPRSGTTLVEQIIARSPGLAAIGEAPYVSQAQAALLETADKQRFRPLRDMSEAEIAGFGHHYARLMRGVHPTGRVVDKSMVTFYVAGLLRLALPNSRIVLVKRDPRDIGLSMFKNIFPRGTYQYSYDLAHLGAFIRLYEEMIAFWRVRAPGAIIEIVYEDLIADPEGESQRLFEALQLEWSPSVLDASTNAEVKTLSVFQVRQPIYKTSAQAWRRYERQLAPLFDTLGDLLPHEPD